MCAQNSFKNQLYECFRQSLFDHMVCCNPLTFRLFRYGLAWKQTKHGNVLVDDGEMNTKLSFELGELMQRINVDDVITFE